MATGFLSQEDVMMRLDRTVCMFKGEPRYITVDPADELNVVKMYKLGSNRPVRHNITDPDFSYKAFELGYCMWGNVPVYLTRNPDRRQKAGLHHNSLTTVPPTRGLGDMMNHKNLEDCIMANHKFSVDDINNLRDRPAGNGIVLTRHFAASLIDDFTIALMYRGRQVGNWDDVRNRFNLFINRETSFLMRIADQEGVPL